MRCVAKSSGAEIRDSFAKRAAGARRASSSNADAARCRLTAYGITTSTNTAASAAHSAALPRSRRLAADTLPPAAMLKRHFVVECSGDTLACT